MYRVVKFWNMFFSTQHCILHLCSCSFAFVNFIGQLLEHTMSCCPVPLYDILLSPSFHAVGCPSCHQPVGITCWPSSFLYPPTLLNAGMGVTPFTSALRCQYTSGTQSSTVWRWQLKELFTEFAKAISVLSLMAWVSTVFCRIMPTIYMTYYFTVFDSSLTDVFLKCVHVTTINAMCRQWIPIINNSISKHLSPYIKPKSPFKQLLPSPSSIWKNNSLFISYIHNVYNLEGFI